MTQTTAITPYQELKTLVMKPETKEQFASVLGKQRGEAFLIALLNIVSQDPRLLECEPVSILRVGLNAAALELPLEPTLGLAYPVPFRSKEGKMKANFILGYRGLIQLALRTGIYKFIHAGEIFEGQEIVKDQLTGEIEIIGVATSDKVIGYCSYFETKKGYKSALYMTVEEIEAHAKRYSKSYKSSKSLWKDPVEFPKMAKKTVLRLNLSKNAVLATSPEAARALALEDESEFYQPEQDEPELIEGEFSDSADEVIDRFKKLEAAIHTPIEDGRKLGDLSVDELQLLEDHARDPELAKACRLVKDALIEEAQN